MLKNKFSRQLTAFLAIALASIFLYPLAEAGLVIFIWLLLGLPVLAALLTLMTK
jgi:hypothetical protein